MTEQFEHGASGAGYRNHGCRCDLCRAAHALATKRTRERARIRASMPSDVEHGTELTYDHWHCRCDVCKIGKNIAQTRRRLERLEAEQTALRTASA